MNQLTALLELVSVAGLSVGQVSSKISFYQGDDIKLRAHIRDLQDKNITIAGFSVELILGQLIIAGTVTSSTIGLVEFGITSAQTAGLAAGAMNAIIKLTNNSTNETTRIVLKNAVEPKTP